MKDRIVVWRESETSWEGLFGKGQTGLSQKYGWCDTVTGEKWVSWWLTKWLRALLPDQVRVCFFPRLSPWALWILLCSFLLWSKKFELHFCSMYDSLNDIICGLLWLGLVVVSSVTTRTTTKRCKKHWGFCISVLESVPPLCKCFWTFRCITEAPWHTQK